jgi:hypothetical protein
MPLEELILQVTGQGQTFPWTGYHGQFDQLVVLAEPEKHRAQHPGDRDLGHPVLKP